MGKLCMNRVSEEEFFAFVACYETTAREPDPTTMKFVGTFTGDCIGRIVYGEEHKRFYINTNHDEPEIITLVTPEGVVQRTYAV